MKMRLMLLVAKMMMILINYDDDEDDDNGGGTSLLRAQNAHATSQGEREKFWLPEKADHYQVHTFFLFLKTSEFPVPVKL